MSLIIAQLIKLGNRPYPKLAAVLSQLPNYLGEMQMAWSWSHTTEAYQYAREQVAVQDRSWLEVVYAEWQASNGDDNLDETKYNEHLKLAKELPDDVLADFIWDKMESQATCTNGGWEAWCCPFGCGCHMVPFSPDEE